MSYGSCPDSLLGPSERKMRPFGSNCGGTAAWERHTVAPGKAALADLSQQNRSAKGQPIQLLQEKP